MPFCPAREPILSPIQGWRLSRIRTFAIRTPSSPSVINVLSTTPNWPFLGTLDTSNFVSGLLLVLEVNPINTVLSSTGVFSWIIPWLSNLL